MIDQQLSVNGKNFKIEKLLGKGKGGYSYLASDGDKLFVLKQIHHEPCSYYTFGDKIQAEISDYKKLVAVGIPMPQLLDVDFQNERILKEFIDGPTVQELVENRQLPSFCVRQVEEMCKLLYAAGLNIDYYPTNFVLQNNVLYYIDYECNAYCEQWNFENWGKQYWILQSEKK